MYNDPWDNTAQHCETETHPFGAGRETPGRRRAVGKSRTTRERIARFLYNVEGGTQKERFEKEKKEKKS